MRKWKKQYIVVANLIIVFAALVFGWNLFWSATVHGASITNTIPQGFRKADLVISNFTITEWQCYNYGTNYRLSGYRNVSFSYVVTNSWNRVAPYYFVAITTPWGTRLGGGGDSTILQPGTSVVWGYGAIKLPGRYKFDITVYPMAVWYIPWSSNYQNFINWSLDANVTNNIRSNGVHINPCI